MNILSVFEHLSQEMPSSFQLTSHYNLFSTALQLTCTKWPRAGSIIQILISFNLQIMSRISVQIIYFEKTNVFFIFNRFVSVKTLHSFTLPRSWELNIYINGYDFSDLKSAMYLELSNKVASGREEASGSFFFFKSFTCHYYL